MKETTAAPKRLALIDRDGTIIVDKVHLRDPDGIEFAPGAIEGLRLLRDAGFALVLITNQSGIARGYFDAATLARIHERLQSMLAAEGLRLEAIYFCPHGPNDGCDCRKPAPGMVTKAMHDFGFRPEEVVVIGDGGADRGAAGVTGSAWPRGQAASTAGRTISAMPLIARTCSLSGAAPCD
jgi:D-glycero-D-manno-heptose 1,7-bisphosphate phosphatase